MLLLIRCTLCTFGRIVNIISEIRTRKKQDKESGPSASVMARNKVLQRVPRRIEIHFCHVNRQYRLYTTDHHQGLNRINISYRFQYFFLFGFFNYLNRYKNVMSVLSHRFINCNKYSESRPFKND